MLAMPEQQLGAKKIQHKSIVIRRDAYGPPPTSGASVQYMKCNS